jgi:nicotinamidase-related amidase
MPRSAASALLIIDMINAFDFEGARQLLPRARRAARAIVALKKRMHAARHPVIYVNDNFGRWRSDLRETLEHCLSSPGREVARLLEPEREDYFVLKPRHSGFQFTCLDVLLGHLRVETLILTGVAANFCVLFTAHDAYMRGYRLFVPRDCVAAERVADERFAIGHMREVTKADVRASRRIRVPASYRRGSRGAAAPRG